MVAAAGVFELAEGLCFNLPDTLARHPENLAHLLERMRGVVPETEAHTQNTFFLWAQRIEHLVDLLPQVTINHCFQWRGLFFIFDERPQLSIPFPNMIFQGYGAFGDFEGVFHLLNLQPGILGNLFR